MHVGPTAFLGVELKDVSAAPRSVRRAGEACRRRAGLVKGDVITSLDSAKISSVADVRTTVLSLVPGKAVPIGWRDTGGMTQTGTITPVSGPPQ